MHEYERDPLDEPYQEIDPDEIIEIPAVVGVTHPIPQTKSPRTLHFALEALQPQPAIEWVVDGLFSTGSLSLVVGEPGCKKTWSMLDLAACVAVGEMWLQYPVIPAPVLVIDEESGYRRLSRRLGDVLRGHGCDDSTPLFYTSLGGFDLGKPADAHQIQDLIYMTGAKFVLIDALVDVMMGRDENAAQFVQPIFHALRQVADNTQAAIVVIHHSAKAGGYRGSSAIKGAVDQMLMVESAPDSDEISFRSDKARDTISPSFAATAHFESEKFYLSQSGKVASERKARMTAGQEFVIRHLGANGDTQLEDICGCADTCSPEAARKGVYTLTKLGYTKRSNAGGFGVKSEYTLTTKGQEYYDQLR